MIFRYVVGRLRIAMDGITYIVIKRDEPDRAARKKRPHLDRATKNRNLFARPNRNRATLAGDFRRVAAGGLPRFFDRFDPDTRTSDECTRVVVVVVVNERRIMRARGRLPPARNESIYARPMRRVNDERDDGRIRRRTPYNGIYIRFNHSVAPAPAGPYLVCYILRDRSRIERRGPMKQRAANCFFSPAPARASRVYR